MSRMDLRSLQRLPRRMRRALQWQRWPRHRQIAVAVWIPVAVVGFVLFTGPNRAGSTDTHPTPTTEPYVPPTAPSADPAAATAEKVPVDALLAGALPGITPRFPNGMSDQLRLMLK